MDYGTLKLPVGEVSTAQGAAPPHAPYRAGHAPYRADVDGLRAVAVVAVLLYHLNNEWLPGGALGVDVFFVISGYVVAGSLLSNPRDSARDYLLAFYARRVRRLAPALLLMVVVASVCIAVLIPASLQDEYLYSAQMGLVGLSNNYFATLRASYFDVGPASLELNPFTHTWSLGVEEQARGARV